MREILYRVELPRDIKIYRARNAATQKIMANNRKQAKVCVAVVEWREVEWPMDDEVFYELREELEQ